VRINLFHGVLSWRCDVVVRAEAMFKEMMDEPLLRMAISRGNQVLSGEGSDVSDHHHGDGDSTVDGNNRWWLPGQLHEHHII